MNWWEREQQERWQKANAHNIEAARRMNAGRPYCLECRGAAFKKLFPLVWCQACDKTGYQP